MQTRAIVAVVLFLALRIAFADPRSELRFSAAHFAPDGAAWFIISAEAHKRVLLSIKDARIASLAVPVEFPYAVSFGPSPTSRYTAVVVFSDRSKASVVDSFGITSSQLERTDGDTHQRLVDSAAEGRAAGEKIRKEIQDKHDSNI